MISKKSDKKKGEDNWWRRAVIYQIYPKSFQSSSNEGVGDLRGIIQRLDHIKILGVDAIWICPIFDSPFKDNGYDIKDYYKISELFGDNETFSLLLKEAKNRNIKVLMDLVVNHSSNEHSWFQEALRDEKNRFRNYYFFRKGKSKGNPPNNWQGIWGGSAWTYNPITDDYYLHYFSTFQPDLNWDNPDLREEIFKIVRFWMDKGISGWRLDAITFISKPSNFDDDDPNIKLGTNLHKYLNQLCSVMREYPDPLIVGECSMIPAEDIWKLSSPSRKELSMTILFDIIGIDNDSNKGCGRFFIKEFTNKDILKKLIDWYNNIKDGTIALHIQSHDQARIVSRWGNNVKRNLSGKMLATFNILLKGVPIIYQGEEISMINNKFKIDEFDDIEVKSWYEILVKEKKVYSEKEYLDICNIVARDHARTPMQWDSSMYGGFSRVKPWIKMNDVYPEINVENSLADKNSIFFHYQKLIQLRKTEKIIWQGDIELLNSDDSNLIIFKRFIPNIDYHYYIICNFFDFESYLKMEDFKFIFDRKYDIVLSNYKDMVLVDSNFIIRPFESIVLKVY